jgi:hypothetical protein
MYEKAESALTMKNTNIPKPSKLVWDYAKWPLFLKEFKTQLFLMCGAAHIRLLYLLQEHDIITDKIRARTFQNMDEELSAITLFSGALQRVEAIGLQRDQMVRRQEISQTNGWSRRFPHH